MSHYATKSRLGRAAPEAQPARATAPSPRRGRHSAGESTVMDHCNSHTALEVKALIRVHLFYKLLAQSTGEGQMAQPYNILDKH